MKPYLIAAAVAALALAACGQPAQEEAAAPAAPASLMDQVQAMAPEQAPVFAWQQLTAYQQAHPEATPPCASIRATESRGVIPDTVPADSVYAAHIGSLVFSVQCGPQLTGIPNDPKEHWLVVFMPGASEAMVVNCANPDTGRDMCPPLSRLAPAAAPAAGAPKQN